MGAPLGLRRWWYPVLVTTLVHHKWVTSAALARWLGVTPSVLTRLIKQGRLRAARFPSKHYSDERPRKTERAQWRIFEDDLEDFLRRFRGDGRVPRELLRDG